MIESDVDVVDEEELMLWWLGECRSCSGVEVDVGRIVDVDK